MSIIDYTWETLPNPFFSRERAGNIIGHISGRARDIERIIMGDQSAILVTGAPGIGKSTLVRYLQQLPSTHWSWRNELDYLLERRALYDTYFIAPDLSLLDTYEKSSEQLHTFLGQCTLKLEQAIQSTSPQPPTAVEEEYIELDTPPKADLRSFRKLLQELQRTRPQSRCFVVLDAIDRITKSDQQSLANSDIAFLQDRGLAFLANSGILRTLIDLIDDFASFGVILTLESLPRPAMMRQFSHISPYISDLLARFAPRSLQIFTQQQAIDLLAQSAQAFGDDWVQAFCELGGTQIFTSEEQEWLLEQTGTHPYVLKQVCFSAFRVKQIHAYEQGTWLPLSDEYKQLLIDRMSERLILFFNNIWNRLLEAIENCSDSTRDNVRVNFYKFLTSLEQENARSQIDAALWESLGKELHYILHNEGIVRYDYDPSQPVYYPGSLLGNYLAQKKEEFIPTTTKTPWLIITRADGEKEQIPLSELEYKLVKALVQHPKRYPEEELMKVGWGKIIESKTFSQRMYQLRKKLKGDSGNDVIINHYGGFYSLYQPENIQLE